MQRTTVRWPMPFGCKAFPNEVLRAVRLSECGTVEEWLRDHDVNRADGGGFTLLLHAARYMAISETAKNVIGFLIERGADVSQSDGNSWSPLHYVASAHKNSGRPRCGQAAPGRRRADQRADCGNKEDSSRRCSPLAPLFSALCAFFTSRSGRITVTRATAG